MSRRLYFSCAIGRPPKRAVLSSGPRVPPPFRSRFRRRIAAADLQKCCSRRAEIAQAQGQQWAENSRSNGCPMAQIGARSSAWPMQRKWWLGAESGSDWRRAKALPKGSDRAFKPLRAAQPDFNLSHARSSAREQTIGSRSVSERRIPHGGAYCAPHHQSARKTYASCRRANRQVIAAFVATPDVMQTAYARAEYFPS